jgi:hypothetical protein
MVEVSSVMCHDNKLALLTLNDKHIIDCLCVDNDCTTILNGHNFANSIEYTGHVLFNIPMNINLA